MNTVYLFSKTSITYNKKIMLSELMLCYLMGLQTTLGTTPLEDEPHTIFCAKPIDNYHHRHQRTHNLEVCPFCSNTFPIGYNNGFL